MTGILYSDDEIRGLAKSGVLSALMARFIEKNCHLNLFNEEADMLIKDIPSDVLRYFCGNTIRSFAYGCTPIDILTQIEEYRRLATSTKGDK